MARELGPAGVVCIVLLLLAVSLTAARRALSENDDGRNDGNFQQSDSGSTQVQEVLILDELPQTSGEGEEADLGCFSLPHKTSGPCVLDPRLLIEIDYDPPGPGNNPHFQPPGPGLPPQRPSGPGNSQNRDPFPGKRGWCDDWKGVVLYCRIPAASKEPWDSIYPENTKHKERRREEQFQLVLETWITSATTISPMWNWGIPEGCLWRKQ